MLALTGVIQRATMPQSAIRVMPHTMLKTISHGSEVTWAPTAPRPSENASSRITAVGPRPSRPCQARCARLGCFGASGPVSSAL